MTRCLLLFDSYGLDLWGALSNERIGLSFYMLLASPAQSFSGRSPLGLSTIFYCLSFETSLFVASYDSQGHGGGIRPRLHRGQFVFLITPRHGQHRRHSSSIVACVLCRGNLFTEQLPSNNPGFIYVFNGRYQETDIPSRDRCLATVIQATKCRNEGTIISRKNGRNLEKGVLQWILLTITLIWSHLELNPRLWGVKTASNHMTITMYYNRRILHSVIVISGVVKVKIINQNAVVSFHSLASQ
jgi:hypothetical protein